MKKNERKREISGRLDKLLKFLKDNNIMQFCKEEENIYKASIHIYTHIYTSIHLEEKEEGHVQKNRG